MSKISKIFSQNKKTLILTIGIGLILSLAPFHFVGAAPDTADFCPGCGVLPWEWPICIKCMLEYIFSLPIRFGFFALVIPLALLGLAAGFIFFIFVGFLSWIKAVCLLVPITHAGIVDIGWTFTRDFANMFFILILVFIGLATILKLKDYEAKKTLPTLIGMALLINFSPVIVGFIVDISNIFTSFFLGKVGDVDEIWGLRGIWDTSFTYFVESMKELFTANGYFFENFAVNIGSFIGIIVQGLVLIVFYGFAALVFLVVIALLFLRIIWLWILTIMAPIAFLSHVLPSTKEVKMVFPGFLHWDEWWEKLIQWSIVGIPIGFFLYLSSWIMRNAGTLIGKDSDIGRALSSDIASSISGTGVTGQFASLLTDMLQPTVAIAILWLGFMISVKSAPEGAKWLMRGATAGFKTAARGGASFLRQATPAVGQWGLKGSRIPLNVGKWAMGTKAGKRVGKASGWAWRKTGAKIPGVRAVPPLVRRGVAAIPPLVKKVPPLVKKIPGVPRTIAAKVGLGLAVDNFKNKISKPAWNAFLARSGIKPPRKRWRNLTPEERDEWDKQNFIVNDAGEWREATDEEKARNQAYVSG